VHFFKDIPFDSVADQDTGVEISEKSVLSKGFPELKESFIDVSGVIWDLDVSILEAFEVRESGHHSLDSIKIQSSIAIECKGKLLDISKSFRIFGY